MRIFQHLCYAWRYVWIIFQNPLPTVVAFLLLSSSDLKRDAKAWWGHWRPDLGSTVDVPTAACISGENQKWRRRIAQSWWADQIGRGHRFICVFEVLMLCLSLIYFLLLLLLATVIKYLLWRFSPFFTKAKLGHPIVCREQWEHYDGTRDKGSDGPPNCRVKRGGASNW
jgi:hypothetical protein